MTDVSAKPRDPQGKWVSTGHSEPELSLSARSREFEVGSERMRCRDGKIVVGNRWSSSDFGDDGAKDMADFLVYAQNQLIEFSPKGYRSASRDGYRAEWGEDNQGLTVTHTDSDGNVDTFRVKGDAYNAMSSMSFRLQGSENQKRRAQELRKTFPLSVPESDVDDSFDHSLYQDDAMSVDGGAIAFGGSESVSQFGNDWDNPASAAESLSDAADHFAAATAGKRVPRTPMSWSRGEERYDIQWNKNGTVVLDHYDADMNHDRISMSGGPVEAMNMLARKADRAGQEASELAGEYAETSRGDEASARSYYGG